MYTREQLKSLSDEQMIAIANALDPNEGWQVSRKYADENQIYEVLFDGGEGRYDAVVQIMWGEQYDTMDGEMDVTFLIRHFDADFNETGPSEVELNEIIRIVNNG
jgi:hypothetical protein